MYESFFALSEKPFSLTPNPRFLFLSKTHNEVYAHLIYGIENRAGFVEVTGEVGTGKTTILRTLLSHLDEGKYRVAFIFNPKLTAFELLRNINQEFGVADDGLSSPDLIQSLNKFLLAENAAGRTPILVIDEAQNLSGEVLEQIRLLSNLETENDKLIQVVLVGQPELRQHLSDHSLRQLNQRIAVRYQLRPLNADETSSYILHRLKIAGRPDSNVFSPAALKRVYQCSGGVPRRINLICDRALLTAFTEERGMVSARDISQAVAELDGIGEDGFTKFPMQWKYLAAITVLAVALLVAILQLSPFAEQPVASVALVTENKLSPAPAQPVEVVNVDTPLESNSLVASCNALFELWEAPALSGDVSADAIDLDREFSSRGFQLVRLAGSFSDLRNFNVPILMPLSPGQGGGYLAVLGERSANQWSIYPPYLGKTELSTDELNNLGVSMAMVPWVDFASIGYVAVPGMRGENVRRLQFLVGLTGCIDIPTNGRYDKQTIECIKEFQRQQGLVVDGLVGPRTLMLLYQVAGAYKMPSLS